MTATKRRLAVTLLQFGTFFVAANLLLRVFGSNPKKSDKTPNHFTLQNEKYPNVDNFLVTDDRKWSLYDIWMETKHPLGSKVPLLTRKLFPKLHGNKARPPDKVNATILNGYVDPY